MAYQSACRHSFLSRLAHPTNKNKIGTDPIFLISKAVRQAQAAIRFAAALDERAAQRRVAEPVLLGARQEQPAARERVPAERPEAGEEQAAVLHRVIGFERFFARPGRLREEP